MELNQTRTEALVNVRLSDRSYDIVIGLDCLLRLPTLVSKRRSIRRAIVICDESVEASHAQSVAQGLRAASAPVDVLSVASGETSKSIDAATGLWNRLLNLKVDRSAVVVAVGGGVIGDLAGFVAATFARGLDFVQVPTTLLAQVDSSVGGKVGINLPGAKNMVGAFWQPIAVLCDTLTLSTLPEREYRSGLAEVVKYGVILDADFFSYLENHVAELNQRDPATLQTVIARCCRLKADVVEQDERETMGVRAVLNYGHTFAHAIEAVAGYGQWLHGEAVSIGMVCAARLARALGRIDSDFERRQTAVLKAFGLPTDVPPLEYDALIAAMSHDKKADGTQVRFVLPTRLGHVETVSGVNMSLARAALAARP